MTTLRRSGSGASDDELLQQAKARMEQRKKSEAERVTRAKRAGAPIERTQLDFKEISPVIRKQFKRIEPAAPPREKTPPPKPTEKWKLRLEKRRRAIHAPSPWHLSLMAVDLVTVARFAWQHAEWPNGKKPPTRQEPVRRFVWFMLALAMYLQILPRVIGGRNDRKGKKHSGNGLGQLLGACSLREPYCGRQVVRLFETHRQLAIRVERMRKGKYVRKGGKKYPSDARPHTKHYVPCAVYLPQTSYDTRTPKQVQKDRVPRLVEVRPLLNALNSAQPNSRVGRLLKRLRETADADRKAALFIQAAWSKHEREQAKAMGLHLPRIRDASVAGVLSSGKSSPLKKIKKEKKKDAASERARVRSSVRRWIVRPSATQPPARSPAPPTGPPQKERHREGVDPLAKPQGKARASSRKQKRKQGRGKSRLHHRKRAEADPQTVFGEPFVRPKPPSHQSKSWKKREASVKKQRREDRRRRSEHDAKMKEAMERLHELQQKQHAARERADRGGVDTSTPDDVPDWIRSRLTKTKL